MASRAARVAQLVRVAPESWHGTTFPNDARYVGREKFLDEMSALLSSEQSVRTEQLSPWFPEDYVRLGSPFSTLREMELAISSGFGPYDAFAFSSQTLPVIAAALVGSGRVVVYGKRLFSEEQLTLLRSNYGCVLDYRADSSVVAAQENEIVVEVANKKKAELSPHTDVLVWDGVFFIARSDRIPRHDIKDADGGVVREGVHTIRKRFGAPPPTPDVVKLLTGEQPLRERPDTKALQQHLKELAGCHTAGGEVLLATVGLSALGACVMSTLELAKGSLDLIMCSTAYGGSSQQADILTKNCSRAVKFTKHTYNIQGEGRVLPSIAATLNSLKSRQAAAVTLLELEFPTNPDMKDCDIGGLVHEILDYQKATNTRVVLMLDTTFAPQSQVASHEALSAVPTIVFNSLSKSVSGGRTTGGSLVANTHAFAQEILQHSHVHLALLDTGAWPSQIQILNEEHAGTETRVAQAHSNCTAAAHFLEQSVLKHSGHTMKVNFVTAEQIAKRVTPATFSFNLPPPKHLDHAALEALAQRFVDRLVAVFPEGVKPCVSFGQKNSYVYATVPATSTQGVIKKQDKDKQAIGGVQLVRFSFPPTMDKDAWNAAVDKVVAEVYKQ